MKQTRSSERVHTKRQHGKIEEQKLKAASAEIDEIRKRAKPVLTDELVSWIQRDRERQKR